MLRLIIQNFQNVTERELNFNANQIIQLSGESGKGKTTIFRAIIWVLYGDSSVSKVIPKSLIKKRLPNVPTVKFHYQDANQYLSIERRKCSDMLHVWTSATQTVPYQQQEAQHVINCLWGPAEYLCGMYIPQKKKTALFLELTDKSKTDLLLHLLFKNNDLDSIRARMEQFKQVKSNEMQVQNTIYQRELTIFQRDWQQYMPDYTKRLEPDQMASLQAELAKISQDVPQLQSKIGLAGSLTSYQEQLQQLISRRDQISNKLIDTTLFEKYQAIIQQHQHLLNVSQPDLSLAELQLIEKQQSELKQWLINHALPTEPWSAKLINNLAQEIQNQRKIEQAHIFYHQMLEKIKPYADLDQYLKSFQIYQTNRQRYDELCGKPLHTKQDLMVAQERVKKQRLELEMSLQLIYCPGCNCGLTFTDGKLIKHDEYCDKDFEETRRKIKDIDQWMAMSDKHMTLIIEKSDLEIYLKDCIITNWLDIEEYNRLELKSREYNQLWHQPYNPNLTKIDVIPNVSDSIFEWPPLVIQNLVKVRTIEQQYQINLVDIHKQVTEQQQWQYQLQELTTQINQLQQKLSDNNIEPISIPSLTEKIDTSQRRQQQINAELQSSEIANRFYARQIELCQQQQSVKDLSDHVTIAATVLDKFNIYVKQRLDQIIMLWNTLILNFTPICFPHNSVEFHVSLIHQLTNKTERYKINIEISIDDDEFSSLDELSGGESDRAIILLSLSLSFLVPGKILLWDEPLNSVQSDLLSSIFKHLHDKDEQGRFKYIPSDKIFMIAQHHLPAVAFDTLITI